MPEPGLIQEQEIIENRFLENIKLLPSQVRKWFVNNVVQRTLAHLVGWTGTHSVMIQATSDGRMRVTTEVTGKTTGSYNQVTIGTTATLIRPANSDRVSIAVQDVGDADIYIGFDNLVTTNNGFKIAPGQVWSADVYLGAVYGIVAAGTQKAAYMEI